MMFNNLKNVKILMIDDATTGVLVEKLNSLEGITRTNCFDDFVLSDILIDPGEMFIEKKKKPHHAKKRKGWEM